MKILFFDTETTGLVRASKSPTDPVQPMPVQLGMKLDAANRAEVAVANLLIQTNGWTVEKKAAEITGIDNKMADTYGIHLITAHEVFCDLAAAADVLVAHNASFDVTVMRRCAKVYSEQIGVEYVDPFADKQIVCTMLASMNIVKAIPKRRGQWKWPKLEECMNHFFNETIEGAHDALVDVRATARVFYQLVDMGAFNDNSTNNF